MVNRFFINTPSNIITTPLNIDKEPRKNYINKIYEIGDHQNNQTNIQAIMTSYNIWAHTSFFDSLLNKIVKTIDIVWPIKDKRYKYELCETWGTIYKKDHYAVSHNHIPNQISFVYYLQSSGNTPLIFDRCNFSINPTDDMLVCFPSYLEHSVPKHNEKEDRIVLAGNLIVKLK